MSRYQNVLQQSVGIRQNAYRGTAVPVYDLVRTGIPGKQKDVELQVPDMIVHKAQENISASGVDRVPYPDRVCFQHALAVCFHPIAPVREIRYFSFFLLSFLLNHHFHFPAQLVGGFTLRDLLDKSWQQVSSLLRPGTCLQFLSRKGFSIPTARGFSSNVANSRSRAFPNHIFMREEVPTSMCTR